MQPIPPPDIRPQAPWAKVPPAPNSHPEVSFEPPQGSAPAAAPSLLDPLARMSRPDFPAGPTPEITGPPTEERRQGPAPLPETAVNTDEFLMDALRPAASPTSGGGLRPVSFAPLWDTGSLLQQAAKLTVADPEREIVLSAARLIERFRSWDELLQARRHNLYKA